MKRTREVTSIHYRQRFRRSVSAVLHGYCPVCGSPLEAAVTGESDSPDQQRRESKPEGKVVFHLGSEDLGKHPTQDSASEGGVLVLCKLESHSSPLAYGNFADVCKKQSPSERSTLVEAASSARL